MSEPSAPMPGNGRVLAWVWLALVLALATVGASLWFSIGLGLKACPLCFYQRTFAMAVVGVLLMGQVAGVRDGRVLAVIVLPLAVAGLGVAGFHVYLETTKTLECPPGLFGLWTIPGQSLIAFGAMSLALVLGLTAGPSERSVGSLMALAALVLGAAFALAAIKGSPPLPPERTTPYDPVKEPVDGCRRPYTPPATAPAPADAPQPETPAAAENES
jgi:disulfide bond formation protein DsbB